MLEEIYIKGDISPRINNEVMNTIFDSSSINSAAQKVFAYCYLGVISYLCINNKYIDQDISVKDIKGYLGYAPLYKKVDYIIKKNGVLYNLGYVEDVVNPTHNKKNRIKISKCLDEMSECHTFNLKLYFKCISDSELGLTGFFILNYIKEFANDYVYGGWGSLIELSKLTGIPKETLRRYLVLLSEKELLESEIVGSRNVNELNVYIRGKLGEWKSESLEIHNHKCFISGEESDLYIHHPYSFSEIRDQVLKILNIEVKPFDKYTEMELNSINMLILNYHKLILGVPLTKAIHNELHSRYGDSPTFYDLIEYKHEYLQGSLQ